MKNTKNGFVIPIIIAIVAVLIIAGGVYFAYEKGKPDEVTQTNSQFLASTTVYNVVVETQASSSSASTNSTQPSVSGMSQYTDSNSGFNVYDYFGIAFQYPTIWGIPKETFYGNGLGSISFDYNSLVDYQSFAVFIQQDLNPQGGELLNETFDQMIARFRTNDKYIYTAKDISADGIQGKELFYNSAVTGQPYHVEAYFPFQNDSYISFGADYQSVPQVTFDSIISTLKWDNATTFKQDPATGMAIYSNNGMRFEYPIKFNTDYASLTVNTSVEKIDTTKVDNNGCYPAISGSGKQSPDSVLTVNSIKFCSTVSGDLGAGQLYTGYTYTTFRNGNAYSIIYSVHASNGCGAYESSPDLSSPENEKYNECLSAQKNFDSTVVKPIQDSISTFTFTN